MRELLIDGDIVLYHIATACEKEIDWGDDLWTLHSDSAEAQGKLNDYMSSLLNTLDADIMTVALSSNKNFRKEIFPEYKLNRKKRRKPLAMNPLRDYFSEKYSTVVYDRLEADDVLGILATEKSDNERIIVSIDKDLKQIPSKISIDRQTIETTSLREADRWHLYQTLVGDTVDNYKGCTGVGPVKANQILSKDCSWDTVLEAYDKAGISKEEALIQARLAKILRAEDYNKQTGEIKLWRSK